MRNFFAEYLCGVSKNLNPRKREKNVNKSVQFSGGAADKVRIFFISARILTAFIGCAACTANKLTPHVSQAAVYTRGFDTLHPEVSETTGRKGRIESGPETR
jgi:hypothetical protein